MRGLPDLQGPRHRGCCLPGPAWRPAPMWFSSRRAIDCASRLDRELLPHNGFTVRTAHVEGNRCRGPSGASRGEAARPRGPQLPHRLAPAAGPARAHAPALHDNPGRAYRSSARKGECAQRGSHTLPEDAPTTPAWCCAPTAPCPSIDPTPVPSRYPTAARSDPTRETPEGLAPEGLEGKPHTLRRDVARAAPYMAHCRVWPY
jgi:hypothetical protein